MRKQREQLQSKNQLYHAIMKNVIILQGMVEHQKKETDLCVRQNKKLKEKYQINYTELKILQKKYEEATGEIQFYEAKNAEFDKADRDRFEL